MTISRPRQIILLVGTLVFVLFGTFPPWMQFTHQGFELTTFWQANWPSHNIARLCIGWTMTVVVTAVALVLAPPDNTNA